MLEQQQQKQDKFLDLVDKEHSDKTQFFSSSKVETAHRHIAKQEAEKAKKTAQTADLRNEHEIKTTQTAEFKL
ncbi:hypothetical protein PABG_12270 [Paracoccidioides brasiliensis Pb03]|nr:hypothetical protein PABG_12270 [Paracoccidioides brasiliensis Pb03]